MDCSHFPLWSGFSFHQKSNLFSSSSLHLMTFLHSHAHTRCYPAAPIQLVSFQKIEGRQKLVQFCFYLEAYAVYYLRRRRAALLFNRHWFSARCYQIQWTPPPLDKRRSLLTGALNSARLLIYDLGDLSALINFSSPSTNPVIDKVLLLLWDWKN